MVLDAYKNDSNLNRLYMHYAAVVKLQVNKSAKFLNIKYKTLQADETSHYQSLDAGSLT